MEVVFLLLLIFFANFSFTHSASVRDSCAECLLLTPLIREGKYDPARDLSRVKSETFLGIESHSGYITVNDKHMSNLFFWYFPHPNQSEFTPWIIWLQGGPGYSSMMGLFDLIGPIQIVNGQVIPRNVSWAQDYSLLFLDNPVGAGFSFTADEQGYPDNEGDVGEQMLEFLQQFLQVFPELQEAPLFIAGESYAGKYIPALGIQIHRHKSSFPLNLRGIMIGNGLIDPRSMMHYSELCRVIGILDEPHLSVVRGMEQMVMALIDEEEFVNAANEFNLTIEYIKQNSGVSIYNYEKDPNDIPVEFEAFLSKPDVRELIHVGEVDFELDSQLVYNKMLPDIMNSTKQWVEDLLEHYGVLSYSGQLDVILAYSLSKYTYNLLQWSRRSEYIDAPRLRLQRLSTGELAGYKKGGGNFVEVLIRNAGHSPMRERPDVTKLVIDQFILDFK